VHCLVCDSQKQIKSFSSLRDWEYGTYRAIDLYTCSDCGLIYQNPLPHIDEVEGFYPENYRNYMPLGENLFTFLKKMRFKSQAKRLMKFFDNSVRVLEIGYGNGQLLLSMKKLGLDNLYGVDFNGVAGNVLAQAKIQSQVANVEDGIPFATEFDVIILNNVIEHFLNPDKILENVFNKLSSKGKVILLTPNTDALEMKVFGRFWAGFHVPRHIFLFNKKNLEILVRKTGFNNCRFYRESDPAQWAFSLQNFLQNTLLKSRLKNGMAWYTIFLSIFFVPISFLQSVFFETEALLVVLEKQ
jgi:SAM-dependent methyltransferase